jgi:hypothetical protein
MRATKRLRAILATLSYPYRQYPWDKISSKGKALRAMYKCCGRSLKGWYKPR